MMFVDYILQWARDKGYSAVYGSPEQVNEMLTNVPFTSSQDGTAVIIHLVADSETYNGHDRAIVAVYFASLCDFDFNGESLLSEQERLKNIGKDLLNDIRTGNVLAYEYPRWQYGYDDYAENVCWVCLRVTITASAADCVPLPAPPEPPTPIYNYKLICPQIISAIFQVSGRTSPSIYPVIGIATGAVVTFAVDNSRYLQYSMYTPWINNTSSPAYSNEDCGVISEAKIESWKTLMSSQYGDMTEETEEWLRDRIGKRLLTRSLQKGTETPPFTVIVVDGASNHESKTTGQ